MVTRCSVLIPPRPPHPTSTSTPLLSVCLLGHFTIQIWEQQDTWKASGWVQRELGASGEESIKVRCYSDGHFLSFFFNRGRLDEK